MIWWRSPPSRSELKLIDGSAAAALNAESRRASAAGAQYCNRVFPVESRAGLKNLNRTTSGVSASQRARCAQRIRRDNEQTSAPGLQDEGGAATIKGGRTLTDLADSSMSTPVRSRHGK